MSKMFWLKIIKISIIFLLGVSNIFAQDEKCSDSFDGTKHRDPNQDQLKQEFLEYILEKYSDVIKKCIELRAIKLKLQNDDHFKNDMYSAFFIRIHNFIAKGNGITQLQIMENEGSLEPYFFGIMKNLSIDYNRQKSSLVSLNSIFTLNGEEISFEVADTSRDVSSADATTLQQAISFLPFEQRELIELENLGNSEQAKKKLLELEAQNPQLFKERRDLAYRNLEVYNQIAFNTSFFKASRRDNPNRRTVSVVWSEFEFYDKIAFLTEVNRRILASYLVEGLSAEEIKVKYGYQNILSVHKQLNRAMSFLKEISGLADRKEVRLDTMVVVLKEERGLQNKRKRFYEGADLLQIKEAEKYRNFDPERDLNEDSLFNLLKLMHPIHANVFEVLFIRGYTKEEAVRFFGYDNLEKLSKLMSLAVAELSTLTKNPKFKKSLIRVLESQFLKH